MLFLRPSDATYEVKLSLFEGPLDLLLHLIEREEMDITKISLAQVTDQYLAYISQLEELQPESLADFLVVAAKLLLIKSQVLLPRPASQLPVAEEDPSEALARQLREYKKFKRAARYLKDRAASGGRTFVRIAPPPKYPRKVDLNNVTLDDLLAAWRQAQLARVQDGGPPVRSPQPTVTIGDKMALLRRRLAQEGRITFNSLLAGVRSRLEVIVTFLALLEMFKSREIALYQETLFDEISIEARSSPSSSTQPGDASAGASREE